jgi:hypothetical protein
LKNVVLGVLPNLSSYEADKFSVKRTWLWC